MDKLRHIQSKVGTETAFRIPISVEDAIAEGVEAYDALAARLLELYSFTDELMSHTHDKPSTDAEWDELQDRTHESALLIHDARVLDKANMKYAQSCDMDDQETFIILADDLWSESEQLRKQAAELEGEG